MRHYRSGQHRHSPRYEFAYFPILLKSPDLAQPSILANEQPAEWETSMSYISRQQQATMDASIWQPILSAWLNMPADGDAPGLSDIVATDFPTAEVTSGLPVGWIWRRV